MAIIKNCQLFILFKIMNGIFLLQKDQSARYILLYKDFKGLNIIKIDGKIFLFIYWGKAGGAYVRNRKGPVLIHAKVPLLNLPIFRVKWSGIEMI